MTRYQAYTTRGWERDGLACIVVTRHREGGVADLAEFIVDTYCLGVKEALLEADLDAAEADAALAEDLPEADRESIHPACAKKLIEGAIAYATALGFAPHRDYRKARRILSGIDAKLCPREFAYGRDGRAVYVRGDHDDDARAQRVCSILEAKFGADGFDYEDPTADDEDDLAERTALIDFLDAEATEVPRFYELSGLLTAMLLAPGQLTPNDAIPVLWEEGTRVWRDGQELQGFLDLLRAYWNQVNARILAAVDPDCPSDFQILDIWAEDFPDNPEGGMGIAMATRDWAKGFQRIDERWPEAWGAARANPVLAEHWELIGWWAGFENADNRRLISTHAEAEPKRTLNQSVVALARALREPLA